MIIKLNSRFRFGVRVYNSHCLWLITITEWPSRAVRLAKLEPCAM